MARTVINLCLLQSPLSAAYLIRNGVFIAIWVIFSAHWVVRPISYSHIMCLQRSKVSRKNKALLPVFSNSRFSAYAIPVQLGITPTLTWRIDVDSKRISFSSVTADKNAGLQKLLRQSDLLVTDNALSANNAAGNSQTLLAADMGRLAYRSDIKQLVISHRSSQTLGKEKQTIAAIKTKYAGVISFANDMDCYAL